MPYVIERNVSDGSATKIQFVPETEEQRKLFARMRLNLPVAKHELAHLPHALLVEKNRNWKFIPDALGMSGGPYVLSPRLHDEIERLEPNAHRFSPIKIQTPATFQGKTEHGFHYLLLPPPAIDCLVYEETRFRADDFALRLDDNGRMIGGGLSSTTTDPCMMRKTDIQGHHLWRLPYGCMGHLFCSDELGAIYKAQKMKGWDLNKVCRAK